MADIAQRVARRMLGQELETVTFLYQWEEPAPGDSTLVVTATPEQIDQLRELTNWLNTAAGELSGDTLAKWQELDVQATGGMNFEQALDEIGLQSRYFETDKPGEYYEGTHPLFSKQAQTKTVCYRITTDEPQGFTVGFHPGPEWDESQIEEFPCVDYGGDAAFFVDDQIVFADPEEVKGYDPEPDMYIWRDPTAFNQWARELTR